MLLSSHDWPCKLLLMCHWLELFIERDELGHEGVGFDLWQCICGLKTPPYWERRVFVHGVVLQCVCVRVFAQSVHLPREYNNSQQTQRLLCSFEAPWMKKLSWEINKSGVMLSQPFFSPLDGPRSFSSCAFDLTFSSFGSTAFETTQPTTLVGRIGHSVNACLYICAFQDFTPLVSNQPLCCRPCCITLSTAAPISLLSSGNSQFQPSMVEKQCKFLFSHKIHPSFVVSLQWLLYHLHAF